MQRKDQLFCLRSRAGHYTLVVGAFFYLLVNCCAASPSLLGQQTINSSQSVPTTWSQASPDPATSQQQADQTKADDPGEMRKTITRLRAENERLRRKIAELERIRTFTVIQDLMAKEEQRVDNLHTQLLTVGEKMANLQSRLDELNEQLRPENIERLFIGGSVRPEEVRESTRRHLDAEKRRVQSQLDLLQQTRSRLQNSLSSHDQAIQRLRARLQDPSLQ